MLVHSDRVHQLQVGVDVGQSVLNCSGEVAGPQEGFLKALSSRPQGACQTYKSICPCRAANFMEDDVTKAFRLDKRFTHVKVMNFAGG
jgi:hypothetical protein